MQLAQPVGSVGCQRLKELYGRGDDDGSPPQRRELTVGNVLSTIDAITGASTASTVNGSGQIVLSTGTTQNLVISGTGNALTELGIAATTTNLTPPALSGKTLTIGATGGGTGEDFLIAAREDERIPALEPDDELALLRPLHENGVDGVLGHRPPVWNFRGIDDLDLGRQLGQQLLRRQPVGDHDVCVSE